MEEQDTVEDQNTNGNQLSSETKIKLDQYKLRYNLLSRYNQRPDKS